MTEGGHQAVHHFQIGIYFGSDCKKLYLKVETANVPQVFLEGY